ncbi:MAG: hypothetical protein HKM89_01720 [Gemmatimonadales bacterium]|nr:hypothetical protein [Gemmatimonadales bacterium]
MSLTIKNESEGRVLLRFNSGLTRHLAPGEVVEGVEEVEVKGNRRIKSLEDKHLVALLEAGSKKVRRGKLEHSRDMTAREAIEHIRSTPLEALRDFISRDEERVTVLEAMDTKRDR